MPDWGGKAALRETVGGFSISTRPMRKAIVYIDGYNLYYSRLRGTPYKWLDLVALFKEHILRAQIPDADLVKVKFFTAPALAKFASHGLDSVTSQNAYHRALLARYPGMVEIISGYHTHGRARLMAFKEPPDRCGNHDVWLIEEKQTDVNLAMALYRDVAQGATDVVVVCSNDTDMEPALAAVQMDFPACERGFVAPLSPPAEKNYRYPNRGLMALADWTRHYIRDEELALAQLPNVVPTRKKAVRRPVYW